MAGTLTKDIIFVIFALTTLLLEYPRRLLETRRLIEVCLDYLLIIMCDVNTAVTTMKFHRFQNVALTLDAVQRGAL